ncbi:myb-related protein 2-like [Forsythia ovata]|uniref:Myb-related protein 2-like n=1 Tax=Forsythia ovata TaxID=205694 RepID=A0ABD1VKR5_9LAMI
MLEKTELRLCEDPNDSSRFLCATNDNVEKAFDIKENSRNLSIVIGPQRGQRNDGSSYSEERFREADADAKYFNQDAYRPEKQKTTRDIIIREPPLLELMISPGAGRTRSLMEKTASFA